MDSSGRTIAAMWSSSSAKSGHAPQTMRWTGVTKRMVGSTLVMRLRPLELHRDIADTPHAHDGCGGLPARATELLTGIVAVRKPKFAAASDLTAEEIRRRAMPPMRCSAG